ncbi:hypothetical protein VZT92_003660 [Zoarces viviparus]|uniref:Immunoglobulin V-set domain-containing protein n=1 Tax=Zoarces viviparus TaxID=48416 RepID=A0AAW1FWH8_ZOAVI
MSIFVILGLLVCIEAQGSSAVTTVFLQKGDDLILNVDADVPEKFFYVDWIFNKTVVVRFADNGDRSVHSDFTERVEFPVKKFSVKLKNLQEADSGVYTAGAYTRQGEDKPLAEYKVTVQGPSAGTSVYLVKMVVFSVGLIIMVFAVITVHLMEKFRKHK